LIIKIIIVVYSRRRERKRFSSGSDVFRKESEIGRDSSDRI
jgi:hypothetical protein